MNNDFINIINNKYHIFLINITKRYGRLLLMNYKLSKINIQYKIIDIPDIRQLENTNSYQDNVLLLTYKKICNTIPENNNKNIIIFEDCIVFHKDFVKELQSKIRDIEKNDIIFLNSHIGRYGTILKPIIINKIRQQLKYTSLTSLLNIETLINNIISDNKLNSCIFTPNLVIPQLEETDTTDNMLASYSYMKITSTFEDIYNNITTNKVSLRKLITQIDNELSNMNISRIIENKNKSFVFIIPSYNNASYYKKNLESVFIQRYPFWRIIYIDDSSTDDTYNLVSKYIIEKNFQNKVTLIKNKQNMKQAYSRYIGYNMCQDDEICCMLDGDDWLFDENVLIKLNEIYKRENLLVSYGNFYYFQENKITNLSGFQEYTKEEIKQNKYRHKWISQHLRTCEASLLKTIPKSYLKYENEWLKCSTDIAEMWWVLEISQGRHANVQFPTYVYNKDASLTYENSFYNKDKHIYWRIYRENVSIYLKNYKHVISN
uniref:Glycosyltransferase 2-like domain-containing protein n=1 Tax=viral metagenome TaxID=1070528 RepID=A0A6C0ESM2_9ZZZZ